MDIPGYEQIINCLDDAELTFFTELAPSYQKAFCIYVAKPKLQKTRDKNLIEVKEALQLQCKNIFDYKKLKYPRPQNKNDLTTEEKIELYFTNIINTKHREKLQDLYKFILSVNPNLKVHYGWNQPMVMYENTFICALTSATNHFSIALDQRVLNELEAELITNGFIILKKIAKINYNQKLNYQLITKIILLSIDVKKDAKGFWQ